jgi:hypothetical protein
MIISSVAVLLLCIRPNDHAGGLCMSPILLYRENWVWIVLFLSKPVDVVFAGFELIRWNLFARFAWLFVSTLDLKATDFESAEMWQDRKVELLEVELLVSSEMLFLF